MSKKSIIEIATNLVNKFTSSSGYLIKSDAKFLSDLNSSSNGLEVDNLNLKASQKENFDEERYYESKFIDSDSDAINTSFFFPDYSTEDYIKDRNRWRKQINNAYGGIGWFYFKIFFNFNTNYGLLGGVLRQGMIKPSNVNTANKYLQDIENLPLYNSENIKDRRESLNKFIKTLSYISSEAPWYFREISGFNNIKGAYTNDFNKEKEITIKCLEEAIDMRLGTLFDLYKYACYDNINGKEIIPANLRKFEMSVMIFNVPFKLYNTGFSYDENKNINPTDINVTDNLKNSMSFKMYTFQNCEFDVDSMNEVGDTLSNENSFNLGSNIIKIKYDRVYEHRMNQFYEYLFGPTGFYWTDSYLQERRKRALLSLDETGGWGKVKINDIEGEKIITDLFEANYLPTSGLGNIYGTYTNTKSKYFYDKQKYFSQGTITGGNIYNYDLGPGTKYFDEKLHRLGDGHLEDEGNAKDIPITYGKENFLKLDWEAEAIRNSQNLYAVEGVQTTSQTWFEKLSEASWKKLKSAFRF